MRAHHVWILLALGCTAAPAPTPGPLGISRFEVHETANTSTVIGRDADGREVGRLELFRGRFTMSGMFAEDHVNPDVMGRKLHVRVQGEGLDWETEGFEPTMELPAHPASEQALAAFLEDEHVRQVLERSGIGFRSQDVSAAALGTVNGTDVCACKDADGNPTPTCPMVSGKTTAVCAGLGSPYAYTVHQRANAGYWYDPRNSAPTTIDLNLLIKCCPYASAAKPDILARRVCPDSGTDTPCGPVNPASGCIVCPTYVTNGHCEILAPVSAGWSDPDAPIVDPNTPYCGEVRDPAAQQEVKSLSVSYCGDGVCHAGHEDCVSCPLDCGCEGFDTCGGGGVPKQCGCTPITRCPAGYQCGSVDDGCGGTVDCSGGLTCDEIVGKKHYGCVADSHRCCKLEGCEDER